MSSPGQQSENAAHAPSLSEAQRRTLATLIDGEWHRGGRTGAGGTVIGTPAVALVRMGMAERRGESRGPNPSASGYEYRITAEGRSAYADALDGRVACGTCHPPEDGTPEREQIDRFATFLRIVNDAPKDAEGHTLVNPRALAYANGEDVDPFGCTGIAASWCPRHGDCACPRRDDGEVVWDAANEVGCPLHADASDHPWPDEAELPSGTLRSDASDHNLTSGHIGGQR